MAIIISYNSVSREKGHLQPEKSRFTNRGIFLGGAVVKNPPANAGDTGPSPGPGRSHMPWSN